MKILWLQSALLNLRAIRQYIEAENPKAASVIADAIEQAVHALANFPQLGRRGMVSGTRELVISGYPYMVVYRIKGNEVHILRIFHTKQMRH